GSDKIDVPEACANLKAGRALVSLGLLTDIRVEDRFGVGDLATEVGKQIHARIRIQSPGWMSADRLDLYMDGERIVSLPILWPRGQTSLEIPLEIPKPKQDVWLVAIASGPAPTAAYWPIARPYRPIRAEWEPRAIGATNPVRVDGDGDGKYKSPR